MILILKRNRETHDSVAEIFADKFFKILNFSHSGASF